MFHLFSDLEFSTIVLLVFALLFVLFYEAINGFHDTANAVATVIYTRALKEQLAVFMAGVFNFFGVFLGGCTRGFVMVDIIGPGFLIN